MLRYWNETAAFKNDVYLLLTALNEPVATLQLPALGAVLTVFTQEDADSIVDNVEGPLQAYKNEVYLVPKQLATLYFPAFDEVLTVLVRECADFFWCQG